MKRSLSFLKIEATANDFVVVDGRAARLAPDGDLSDLAVRLADRRLGVGCDQVLAFFPSRKADCRMRIFNPDGTESEICGNGLLAAGLWMSGRSRRRSRRYLIEVIAGLRDVWGSGGDRFGADMRTPAFTPDAIPLDLRHAGDMRGRPLGGVFPVEPLEMPGPFGRRTVYPVSMGNTHAVLRVDDVDALDLPGWGGFVETHPIFPRRANVEFIQPLDEHTLKVRVWERGTGETFACGTGACASATAGLAAGLVKSPVTIRYRGGELRVFLEEGRRLTLEGRARQVFSGEFRS